MRTLLLSYLISLNLFGNCQTRLAIDTFFEPKNPLSIELKATYHPLVKDMQVTLKFDGRNWFVTMVENTPGQHATAIDITPKNKDLFEVYKRLVKNDVFVLPNQFDIDSIINTH